MVDPPPPSPHPGPHPRADGSSMDVQAVNTQEANKAASNRLPPLWAMVAMVLLGWNEAMSILTSPLRLVSGMAFTPGHSWHNANIL